MYGENKFGLVNYGEPSIDDNRSEEHFIDLSQYAPPFIAEIKEIQELYQTQGYEIGLLRDQSDDLIKQCFVRTATWGLAKWEKFYNLTTNLALTYEQRREIIVNKIRSHNTATKQMIQDTAEKFCGGEVEIIEYPSKYSFVIRFVGVKGIPRNMQAFIQLLEEIKPAHLAYDFEYTYTAWEDLENFLWDNLGEYTWNELKTLRKIDFTNEMWESLEPCLWNDVFWRTWDDFR